MTIRPPFAFDSIFRYELALQAYSELSNLEAGVYAPPDGYGFNVGADVPDASRRQIRRGAPILPKGGVVSPVRVESVLLNAPCASGSA